MRTTLLAAAVLIALALLPSAVSAATCADHGTQAEAQRAADTRDTDGDGIYCESLPCPCSTGPGSTVPPPPPLPPPAVAQQSCRRPGAVRRLRFSAARYPNIRRHALAAIGKGSPRILVLNRPNAAGRRDRLLEGIPTKAGSDRDEYPPAVGRGRANGDQQGLVRGADPIGWMADVRYVPSAENRSHGASMGAKLRGLCNGTRFRYVFVR